MDPNTNQQNNNQQNNYYFQQPQNANYNTYPSNVNNLNNEEPLNQQKNEYDLESGNHQIQKEINVSIRMGFIRKVYGILSAQLLLTTLFVSLTFSDSWALFFNTNIAVFWICLALSLITAIVLICFKNVARSVPLNYILLTIWTFCESWMVATCASFYEPTTVFIAAALTAAVTCGLTVYACTTKTDFTFCGGMLFAGSVLMFFMGLLFLIFGMGKYGSTSFKIINILYCGMGVLLYSIYLIYDTQLVMGKFGNEYSIDDYIIAAMNIYIDIIQLFLYILRMVGSRR